MPAPDDRIDVNFHPSQQQSTVSLRAVESRIVDFLEHYADIPFVELSFAEMLGGTTGAERFARLTELAGYSGAPQGFLREVIRHLERAGNGESGRVAVGGVELPYHLLLAVLEELIPGPGAMSVKRVTALEELTNTSVPADSHQAIQQILDLYPVRLSKHTIRQMRLSRAIAHQYYPFIEELEEEGEVHTWVGQFFRGIVEQMYRNRVILIMNMACPVYCRFCFRKHKECRSQRAPTKEHVKQSLTFLRTMEDVKEVVLTGGDPFMNRATLRYAIQELGKIPQIQTLRLASRGISYAPDLFLHSESNWIRYLIRTNLELLEKGKRLEIATHFLHPDELSVYALDIVSQLTRNGIPVYVQTPFVHGCNETGKELVPLYNALRAAGAEIHYIFMPTSPIQGNRVYWSTIAQGLEAARYLRAHLSDRAMPHITTATRIGKIDWNTSGWAVEQDVEDPEYLWIRTPYNEEYYLPFAPILQTGDKVRHNAEGTLDAAFRVRIGDAALFAGPRTPSSSPEAHEFKQKKTAETVAGWLEVLQSRSLSDQRALDVHLGWRPVPCMARNHPARLEIDCAASDEEIGQTLGYLAERPEITDVVISRKDDVLTGVSRTLKVLDRVLDVPHVLVARLRSHKLLHSPQAFSVPVLNRLAGRNKLRVVRPHRLEVETTILHSSEIKPEHARVVRELRLRGITVYANTPLLGFINDQAEEMLRISYACRELGIEYNNVYVTGTSLQRTWNAEHPIDLNGIVDIATHVRRYGSGREVPRYLVRTPLGEVDYSIAPPIFSVDDERIVRVTLRPHDLDYYRRIDPTFEWPQGVAIDDDGNPSIPLEGVTLDASEFLGGPSPR
ncbi:MAG: radical SAM protein [Deltaproteobacteria bacterium]|nr:radical SAM protein [Deltaproteobacteria bacterium]MBW2534780.1 radical SAM protein [Deltaproteobacteria bacterium]